VSALSIRASTAGSLTPKFVLPAARITRLSTIWLR
jgi:hypothetical protein